MTDFIKRKRAVGGVALALAPLLLFVYFGLSTRLLWDDYDHLGLALRYGAWEALLYFRGSWNGHYSSFLMFGLAAQLGTAAPPFFAVAHLLVAVGIYGSLVNAVLRRARILSYRREIVVALAALMVAATINGLYSAHAFFWFSSAVLYTWPAVFLLIGIALAGRAESWLRGRVQHIVAAIVAAIYAFLNAGLAEMYLMFQLSALALITPFVIIFQTGAKRRTNLMLALAACLGTLAGLALVLNAPGFANRSAATVQVNFLLLPIQEQLLLVGRALNETMIYVADQDSFAGFVLVASAGMFMTLSASNRYRIDPDSRRIRAAKAPFAVALIVQLLFIPILWSHSSDNIQLFGRFSYGFATVVGINLLVISALLALLWQRSLNRLLQRRNGLMIYCSGILLAVCFLFTMTQIRVIHVKASAYFFFTVLCLLLILGTQLASVADEPRLKRLLLLTVCVTAGAILTLAFVVSVEILLVRFVNRRSISAAVYAMMLAGMMIGVTLGALLRHGFDFTGAKPSWIRMLRLSCLVVALTIGAGIVIGHGQRIPYVREYVDIWESQHQEIVRLRDKGDPSVFTMKLKRIVAGKMDHTPPPYWFAPIHWKEKVFYGLDWTRGYE